MDVERLKFLASEAGERALANARLLPADRLTRLTRLRREYNPLLAAGIVEMLELRQRARVKFSRAERMFFTPEGLEQSTGEAIAAYRANRFPAETPILDACCGIGSDALALARRAPVLAVDRNPIAAACAQLNARVLAGLEPNAQSMDEGPRNSTIHTVCGDVTSLDLARLRDQGIGAAFFDPSRRLDTREGRKRARNAEDYLPPLSFVNALREHFPSVGVKVSPAIDDATLHRVGGWVEFIAEGNECKEAVLWSGPPAETFTDSENPFHGEPYCATVVQKGGTSETLLLRVGEAIHTSAPRAWLIEPNPAVIRAHLVSQIALRLGGAYIDPEIAYLTADAFHATPFATGYRILEWMPFHLKNVQAWLRANGRRVEVVKKRGVDLEPEEIRKKLASSLLADNPSVVLVLMRRKEQTLAILCDPPQRQTDSFV